jgi:hypothetical protein
MPVGNNAGSSLVNKTKGIANGLTFRPLLHSVTDIHEWWHSDVIDDERRDSLLNGPSSLCPKEEGLLKEWHELQEAGK